MADTYCLLSSLFILLVGTHVSNSLICNRDNFYACENDNIVNGCVKFRATIACLMTLEDCTDDELRLEIHAVIGGFSKSIDNCPGLADGMCIHLEVKKCDKDVPYELTDWNELSKEEEVAECNAFKGKAGNVTACLEKIKSKCVMKSYHETIDNIKQKVVLADQHCLNTLKEK